MATAVEYGLISALIAVAAIGAISSFPHSKPPVTAVDTKTAPRKIVLIPYKDKNGIEYKDVVIDVQTRCQYLVTYEGITLRQMKYKPSDCLRQQESK